MPATKKKYKDADWLREQYVEENKNTYEIAEECSVSRETVRRSMKENDIERRNRDEARNIAANYKNENWLEEQYWGKQKTQKEIADECDVSPSTIRNWLNKYNLKTRNNSWQIKDSKIKDKSWLKQEYQEKKKSTTQIAEENNIARTTVMSWLDRHNIETRDKAESLSLAMDNGEKYKKESWLKKQYKELDRTSGEIAKIAGTCKETICRYLRKYDLVKTSCQNIVDGMKKCSKCGEWYDTDQFYKAENLSTGLSNWCKKCISKQRNAYNKKRKENDPKFKLDSNFGSAICMALKGKKGGIHWEKMVPYSLDDLKEHLEKQFEDGMSWDNYGDWHVDHIIPKSYFNYKKPEDEKFQECWSLSNLQPLWAEENLAKSDNLNWENE